MWPSLNLIVIDNDDVVLGEAHVDVEAELT
jgi:hypothetical protein